MGTITAKFLGTYEWGGVAHTAIDVVRELYNLWIEPRTAILPENWQRLYKEELPKQIKEQTEAFDFSQITGGRISPIIAEIEGELRGLPGDERERYLFSLLTPFSELASIYNPAAEINRLNASIAECRGLLAMWEKQPQDKVLYNTNGEPTNSTPKEQGEACKRFIERYEKDIERLHDINRRFCEVVSKATKRGKVEYYCSVWLRAAMQFAHRLDALLLTFGIDLLQLQEQSGIYLISHRLITDVVDYIGSWELAQHYINAVTPRHRDTSTASTTTDEQQNKPKRGKGRPKETFKDKMKNDPKGEKLQKIHTLADCRKGKDFALIILACILEGWIDRPTYTQVKNEFGDIGDKSGYNKYLQENRHTKEEIEGAKNSLK